MIREVVSKCAPNELQTKDNFDNVKPLNGKPSAETEGFTLKNSDLVTPKPDNGRLDSHIISEPPNLYKQTGALMSKIPYFFETPIPKYFREKGLFKNEKTWKFVTWAFAKCSNQAWTTEYDNCEITLEPYESICGRNKSSAECFLTPKEFRGQLNSLLKRQLLKKGANTKANRYSSYIWVVDRFSESKGQLNGQPRGQPRANSGPQSRRREEEEDKRNHPSIPSFENEGSRDGKIDDLFSKEEDKNKIHVHSGAYANKTPFSVHLTKEQLDDCIKSRGSLERIKDIIDQVAGWQGRKYEIKDWYKTIKEWKFKNVVANRISENEEMGKRIQDLYGECKGWSARIYRDPMKDVKGILFESSASVGNPIPIFVPFSDANFKEKCIETIKAKQMKKKGEK